MNSNGEMRRCATCAAIPPVACLICLHFVLAEQLRSHRGLCAVGCALPLHDRRKGMAQWWRYCKTYRMDKSCREKFIAKYENSLRQNYFSNTIPTRINPKLQHYFFIIIHANSSTIINAAIAFAVKRLHLNRIIPAMLISKYSPSS